MCLVPAPGVFWVLRNDFSKGVATGDLFVAVFAKNESLYRRISTKYCKYKSSKLFWRILEDNKQNKHENGDIITVRIFACRSPIRLSLQHRLLKHNEFLPAWPSLSFLPSNPCLGKVHLIWQGGGEMKILRGGSENFKTPEGGALKKLLC